MKVLITGARGAIGQAPYDSEAVRVEVNGVIAAALPAMAA